MDQFLAISKSSSFRVNPIRDNRDQLSDIYFFVSLRGSSKYVSRHNAFSLLFFDHPLVHIDILAFDPKFEKLIRHIYAVFFVKFLNFCSI